MRRGVAVHDVVALLDIIAFLNGMCLPLGTMYSTGSRLSSAGSMVMRRLFL